MEAAERFQGFYMRRRFRSIATSPTPPLPCHVARHVFPVFVQNTVQLNPARPAIPYAEAVSANLDRPCVFQLNVVPQGGHRSTGERNSIMLDLKQLQFATAYRVSQQIYEKKTLQMEPKKNAT